MPPFPPNEVITTEARRLAAKEFDRDLDQIAELLAQMGHHGPDGMPYPAQTVRNLLDDDLRSTRDERSRECNSPAAASSEFAITADDACEGGAAVDNGAAFGRLMEGGPRPDRELETFLDLLAAPGGARVERIVSRGAASPPDFWYEQAWDEFVLVVSGAAALAFPDGGERRLLSGDYAILPAFCRHRVAWTDPAGETVWLAVHMPPKSRRTA